MAAVATRSPSPSHRLFRSASTSRPSACRTLSAPASLFDLPPPALRLPQSDRPSSPRVWRFTSAPPVFHQASPLPSSGRSPPQDELQHPSSWVTRKRDAGSRSRLDCGSRFRYRTKGISREESGCATFERSSGGWSRSLRCQGRRRALRMTSVPVEGRSHPVRSHRVL